MHGRSPYAGLPSRRREPRYAKRSVSFRDGPGVRGTTLIGLLLDNHRLLSTTAPRRALFAGTGSVSPWGSADAVYLVTEVTRRNLVALVTLSVRGSEVIFACVSAYRAHTIPGSL